MSKKYVLTGKSTKKQGSIIVHDVP